MKGVSLTAAEIVGSQAGPHLLITGGVHGDEFEPMAAIRQLIGCWPREAMRGRVTLIPVVNEPAFSNQNRTADDGLDLARVCPGRDDGTVTERVAAALSRQIAAADYYIDLHTGGTRLELAPMTGYMLHSDERILEIQRRMAHAFGLPIVWGSSSRLEGRSLSVARDAGVPAIYTEFGGAGVCRQEVVRAYVEGCLNVAAALQMIDRPKPVQRAPYVVEDHRESSGHLQIQYPAPADGFFEPNVALRQTVEVGSLLGRVVDPLGNVCGEIHAREAGMVLMLRTFPAVRQNDPLACVLPITAPGAIRID